jgi:hypothetical protein
MARRAPNRSAVAASGACAGLPRWHGRPSAWPLVHRVAEPGGRLRGRASASPRGAGATAGRTTTTIGAELTQLCEDVHYSTGLSDPGHPRTGSHHPLTTGGGRL